MSATINRPDGLHINTSATLQALIADRELQLFADGLVVNAVTEGVTANYHAQTLTGLLHRQDSAGHGLLTAFLILDAELNAVVNDEARVFPLAAFMNYRTRLQHVPIATIRCPPLNKDGHYFFSVIEENKYLAVRLDVHPTLKVAGRVRIATAAYHRSPQRLHLVEHRLDRKVLNHAQLEAALAREYLEPIAPPLSSVERERLAELLDQLIRA